MIKNLFLLLITGMLLGGCQSGTEPVPEATPAPQRMQASPLEEKPPRTIPCAHMDSADFYQSLNNPRQYDLTGEGNVLAGVIPHHDVAATLISGFFSATAATGGDYDTVVIIAPNHDGDLGDIIYSPLDWYSSYEGGTIIPADREIIGAAAKLNLPGVTITQDSYRMAEDHSASILVPYAHYYLPDAEIASFLVSRTLSLDDVLNFATALENILQESGKKVLLVCSVDFSHYLTPEAAFAKDEITLAAMAANDYWQIHDFSNDYMDSPASFIIFLHYMESLGASPLLLDHTDASAFLGKALLETTSYFVFACAES